MINPILVAQEEFATTTTSTVLGYGSGQTVPPRYLLCSPTANMTVTLPLSTATAPLNTGVPNYIPGAGPGFALTVMNLSSTYTVTLVAAAGDTLVNVPPVLSALYSSTTVIAVPSTNNWYGLSTGSAYSAGIQSVAIPLTAATINAMNATPIVVVPAQGSGTLIDVIDGVLDLTYGSAAFANGGAAQLSYGSGTTNAASATIAATVFTTFSASQSIKFAGAMAVTATSATLNAAVNFTNATAPFITGTGATGVLNVSYRVIGGLS